MKFSFITFRMMNLRPFSFGDSLKSCLLRGLSVLGSAGMTVGLFAATEVQPAAIDIGDRNQVFIDGRYLHEKQNVCIVVCPPVKTNEKCLVGQGMKVLRGYGNIMAVDGIYRGFDALSKDGAQFRRVKKGTPPEPDDIVGYVNGKSVVFKDPSAPPEQRYKLADPQVGRVQASANGTEWQPLAEKMFPVQARYPRGMDSQNVIFYDPRIRKYVAYVRVNERHDASPERRAYFETLSRKKFRQPGYYSLRSIGRSVTGDLPDFPCRRWCSVQTNVIRDLAVWA
jgi:hypothetical protein